MTIFIIRANLNAYAREIKVYDFYDSTLFHIVLAHISTYYRYVEICASNKFAFSIQLRSNSYFDFGSIIQQHL